MKENRELLEKLGIPMQKVRGNSGKTTCPQCSHTRKKKNDPCLSVNVTEGLYKCHNCDWSGGVSPMKEKSEEKKEYIIPPFVNTTECSKLVVDWFFKRGITQKTLNDAKITESMEWIPGVEGKIKAINFNYFREGKLVNTKFRGGKKKFKMVPGAELIFYGLDRIEKSETVIITEGEIDTLSFWQSGVNDCISVPNGASVGNGLGYLDSCIDYFTNKKKIILATDSDDPGIKLREELARRLGYHRCYKVDFGDCKDANEYLQKYGPVKLKEVISDKNLKQFPLAGILNLEDVFDEVDMIWESGGLDRGLLLDMKGLDDLISWVKGQLTVITGIPNHGKSIIALQIMLLLSVKHGWKWGVFSPEHKPISMFIIKIMEMLIGKMARTRRVTESEREKAKNFIKEYLYFIEPEDDNKKLDNILDKARMLVIRHGISGLIIDPWNKLEYDQPAGMSETNFVSQQLDKVISFNQNHGVHTIIVAHPTKAKKNGYTEKAQHVVPDLSDIAGSANWHNKPDNGIVFYRNFNEYRNEFYVKKVKWEHVGKQGYAYMKYNNNNCRFSHLSAEHDNSNWLIPQPVQAEMFENVPEPIDFNHPVEEVEDAPF